MADWGPNEGGGTVMLETDDAPKSKRGRQARQISADAVQLSFLSLMEAENAPEPSKPIRTDPIPSIGADQPIRYDDLADGKGRSANLDHVRLIERFPSLQPFQVNRPGTARARLVTLLNRCVIDGRIPRGDDPAKINRKHFAQALGVSIGSIVHQSDLLSAYEGILEEVEPLDTVYTRFGAKIGGEAEANLGEDVREVLARYPKLHRHQFYPVGGNAGRLVDLLNSQILSGNIERSRGGKLNRSWLTERLGVTQSAIAPYNDIVSDYERSIGGVESATEAKIPEMRKWLDECLANGTLEIRDQKIARTQLFAHFGMPKNSLALLRYPRIAELVEEYDELVLATGYQPKEIAEKVLSLKALLADGPEINKDGRTINRFALNRALSLPVDRVLRPPFIELILEADQHLLQAIESDPFISVTCGRVFKFGGLIDQGWPETFALRIKESFERSYRALGKDQAKVFYYASLDLLSYVAASTSPACVSVKDSIVAGVPVKTLERGWTMVTQEYRDEVGVRYGSTRLANTKLKQTNKILRNFGNDAVLPPHTLNLVGFREDNPTHLRSVAEITPASEHRVSNPHIDEYLKFATSMLTQAAISYELEISVSDQSDFNKVLRIELGRQEFKAAENPAAVILRVLERRLQLLEDAAVRIVEIHRKDWEYGQTLVARGVDPGEDWSKIIDIGGMNRFERDQLLRKHFPHKGESKEQGVANLLAVVVNRYESQYPSNVIAGRSGGQFFQKRALEYGGAKKLQGYLTPAQPAVAAVNTLYLLASGSNVSVGREMHFECIEASEEPRHSKVTGYKSRAGGKPIFVTLEDKSPAIQGMRWLQEACATGRRFAGDDAKQLFISRASSGGGFKIIEEWTYRAEFKAMVASIPELADLPLTPNMLRPSILLKAVLQSDGRTRLSMALGQHGAKVHNGYIDKYPTRLLRDTDIRHFMHSLETVVIQRVDEALEFLGISPEGFESRVEAVMKTGLGTMCADRHGRPGNNGQICTSIDCWNDCPQLLVIARSADIAILQIWQHSLRAVEGEWIRDRPERWAAVWLPWLSFVDAVEVKMRQPAFLAVWKEATELANQFKSHPNFQAMRLF